MTHLTELYDLLRVILDDHDATAPQYEDATLAKALQACVRCGFLPGYTLTPNRLSVTPDFAKPADLALLLYRTAQMLVAPRPEGYQFRTRSLSESFGSYQRFKEHLEEVIFKLENGEALFSGWQHFHGWFEGLFGLSIPRLMTEAQVRGPWQTLHFDGSGVI